MIQITLLKDTYFFIGNKLHVTDEQPGPVDIEESIFTEQEKGWLIGAALEKKIKIVKDGNEMDFSRAVPVVTKVASTLTEADQILKAAEEKRENLKKNANILLDGAPQLVLKRINSSIDIALLKTVLTIEKRPKVSKGIQDRINVLAKEIASTMGPGVTEKDVAFQKDGISYDLDITEEVD